MKKNSNRLSILISTALFIIFSFTIGAITENNREKIQFEMKELKSEVDNLKSQLQGLTKAVKDIVKAASQSKNGLFKVQKKLVSLRTGADNYTVETNEALLLMAEQIQVLFERNESFSIATEQDLEDLTSLIDAIDANLNSILSTLERG